jgi:hypothetical protein
MSDYTIGPRQNVSRAKHPTLGEGIAVRENGPAFFKADSGEVVPMKRIRMGGAGSRDGGPFRSYDIATALDGSEIELDTTHRESGDSHSRRWHSTHGAGWLVFLGKKCEQAMPMRFDPDEGRSFEMMVGSMQVGRPGALDAANKKRGKKRLELSDEDEQWITYKMINGEVLAFRRAPPPVEAAPPADRQTSLIA